MYISKYIIKSLNSKLEDFDCFSSHLETLTKLQLVYKHNIFLLAFLLVEYRIHKQFKLIFLIDEITFFLMFFHTS